jgi:hypothetical protein
LASRRTSCQPLGAWITPPAGRRTLSEATIRSPASKPAGALTRTESATPEVVACDIPRSAIVSAVCSEPDSEEEEDEEEPLSGSTRLAEATGAKTPTASTRTSVSKVLQRGRLPCIYYALDTPGENH